MLLKFWGTRGSIPAPVRPDRVAAKITGALELAGKKKIDLTNPKIIQRFVAELSKSLVGSTIGGNTTCVTIEVDDTLIIFDAGSGIRELGEYLMDGKQERARKFGFHRGKGHAYMFFTHTHWDHIQGLPFFRPIYVTGNVFEVYHIHEYVPAVLARQMEQEVFPIRFKQIEATLQFHQIQEGEPVNLAGAAITNIELKHPGKAYAYRVDADNAVAILATDGEYKDLGYADTEKYRHFYAHADALIFDAMFSVREAFVKEDWGHSSALIGADIAREANVKRLYLFHHDPVASDAEILRVLEETREYLGPAKLPEVLVAREGLEVNLYNPAPPPDFAVQDHLEHGIIFMTLSGNLGARATEQFRKRLADSLQTYQSDRVILRMEDLSELTMAGIRALVDTRKSVMSLALVGMRENVYRVLELAGTTDFFAIYSDVESALAALSNSNHH